VSRLLIRFRGPSLLIRRLISKTYTRESWIRAVFSCQETALDPVTIVLEVFRSRSEARDGKARAGRLFTHGEVRTPGFMPGARWARQRRAARRAGGAGRRDPTEQHYHLYLRPGSRCCRQLGGVQSSWRGHPILTDSGGFQYSACSDLRKVTEEGVAVPFAALDARRTSSVRRVRLRTEIGLGGRHHHGVRRCTEHPAEYARTAVRRWR